MASGTKWSRSQDQVGGHGLMSLLRMGQGLNYCASLGMGSFLGTSNVGLFETSSMGDVDPICQYDGRKSEKMMLASPLDPLPDLRKDFRPWSIPWREDHGTVIRSLPWAPIAAPKGRAGHKDPTARAKDKEQRPSHSDSDSVVSHKGRAGHKDHVAERHGLCDQLDLRAAPEFWQRQGPRTGPRCKNRFCGFWVPNVLVFMLNRKS